MSSLIESTKVVRASRFGCSCCTETFRKLTFRTCRLFRRAPRKRKRQSLRIGRSGKRRWRKTIKTRTGRRKRTSLTRRSALERGAFSDARSHALFHSPVHHCSEGKRHKDADKTKVAALQKENTLIRTPSKEKLLTERRALSAVNNSPSSAVVV
jgi:hypothetical protein